ncbi:MAG TPA: TonB-dependent receptor plug domain-containing protein, partial [Ramlibacter sp.]
MQPLRATACLMAAAASLCAPTAFAQSTTRTPTLPETVVRATRFPEPAASLPAGVSVISAEEIRSSGATTVNEALMRVLGVVGRQDFFGAGDFSLDLRGFGSTAGSNQVVILDGERLNESDTGGARLASIPIDAVERIEVLRGSGAVLYGEGATGGVIVITTKAGAGTERVNSASLQAGAGSHRLRDLRANATVAAGGFSFDVHGQKREGDNHREHFHSDNRVASFTGQWANEWLRAGVRHARDDLDAQLPGALTLPEFQADARQSTPGQRSTAGMEGERNSLFASARLGAWQLEADAAKRTRTVRSLFATGSFDSDIEATSFGLRARGEGSVGGLRNILVIGHDQLDWDRTSLAVFPAFGTSASRANQDSRAWYVKDDVVLAAGTRLGAGFR